MSDKQRPLVVIKKDFGEEPAPHGGSWKVAMADLMISMFALFLILWLIEMLDTEDKEKLVEYFKTGGAGVHQTSGGDAMIPGFNSLSPITLENVATSHYDTNLHRVNDTSLLQGEVSSEQQLELLAKHVREQVERLNGTSSVRVETTPQGLRIVIHDSDKGSMFLRGGSQLTYFYEDLLLGLGPLFQGIDNSVIVVGHTDASKFIGSRKTNWELSAERAGQARYYLERGGMPSSRVYQVSGVGDTKPINKEDPKSAVNRRVELFILTKEAREEMDMILDASLDLVSESEILELENELVNDVYRSAEQNQYVFD